MPDHLRRPRRAAADNALHRACAAHFTAIYRLTPAEAHVAAALALGGRARAIAEARCVSLNTIRTLQGRAYAKLGVTSQIELITELPRLWPQKMQEN